MERLKTNTVVYADYIDITKSKTPAGIRQIPIHDKIREIIVANLAKNTTHLIMRNGSSVKYITFMRDTLHMTQDIHLLLT